MFLIWLVLEELLLEALNQKEIIYNIDTPLPGCTCRVWQP
jgi:hypothetical protein